MIDHRPLETLAAFALSFAAGMLSAALLGGYAKWVHRHADAGNSSRSAG